MGADSPISWRVEAQHPVSIGQDGHQGAVVVAELQQHVCAWRAAVGAQLVLDGIDGHLQADRNLFCSFLWLAKSFRHAVMALITALDALLSESMHVTAITKQEP